MFTDVIFSLQIEQKKKKELHMDQNVQMTFHLPLPLYPPSINTDFMQCNGMY